MRAFRSRPHELWNVPTQQVEANRLLNRTIDILEELVRSVAGGKQEPSKRLEEEYAFMFRRATEAMVNQDMAVLNEVLELLAYERETWRRWEKIRPQASAAPMPHIQQSPLPTAGFSFQA